MDMKQVKAVISAHGGIEYLNGIIFDNSRRWFFEDRDYSKEPDARGDYPMRKVADIIVFDETNETVSRKLYYPGVNSKDRYSDKEKRYVWVVNHVENIQGLLFVDDNNKEYRGHFDHGML